MIIATHGIVASQLAAFDADAQAFFDRVTTAGGSLSATEQNAVNTLVLDLKGYSIWNSMKAIYPMVGASAASCSQNLKSSSFTGTFTSGWTFASTGATPNGTSAYMNTGLAPSGNLSLNNSHMSYYSRTNATGGVFFEMGVEVGATNKSWIAINVLGNTYVQINSDTTVISTSNSDTRGFYIADRVNSTQHILYRNNVKTTNSANSTALNTSNIYVGGVNPNLYSNKQCAFASIGDGLTDTEAGNLYTAVQAFQTTLARQV
jgi:hypothetical protein